MVGSNETKVLTISVRIPKDEYDKIVNIIKQSNGKIRGISGLFKPTVLNKIAKLLK